ncbi:Scr1 family TA system antitoxin-like transcriptional regulator [Streptomyces anulatus]|uniref:helix-turn-helix domain-containing protein n=1 Tax=Streptomyces TaxID=1883 RepID=UPI00093EA341|nr:MULTISPECIES: helix-turn-helix transcriptional regulator [unclassified Streptomyces]OKJ14771.1 DNA-binding protein [Streptomyces sp. TSRI0261]QNQ35036.1 helix-turn-helix transcriptional regulator [Streptomyces sp. CB00271]
MASAENKETASPMARMVAEVARTLRIQRGWTQEQLGRELGYSAAAVSAMETCAQPASDAMLVELERVLGNGTGVFETARRFMRMEKYPLQFQDYALLEQAAISLQLFATNVVHGLFQTEAYARALIGGGYPPLSDQRVEELVQLRMERTVLFDRDPLPMIEIIIDEAVLRRVIGGEEVMREQLLHLVECARRRNVTLLVLPLDAGMYGEYAGARGEMNMVETPAHEHLVYLEVQDESLLISDPAKVSTYAQRYAKIRSQALGPRESLDLIKRLAGVAE